MTDTAPAIGFSIAVQLDDKRGITAQTHVDQNASQTHIDGVLDKVFASIERRSLIYELEMWKRKLFSDQKNIIELQRSTEAVHENARAEWENNNRKGGVKLSAPAQQSLVTFKTGLDRSKEGIAIAEERIAEIEKQLAPKPEMRVVA